MTLKQQLALGVGLACLGLASCFYSFDNPIEVQPNNTLAGTVVVADALCGSAPENVQVTVLWTSGYRVHPSSGGKFLFSGLPDGVYSLRYDYFDPDAGPGANPTCTGLQPNIELPRVLDTTSDALDLGTFSLEAPATLTGFVDGGAVIGTFAPDGPGGPGLYESYWTQTDSNGNFTIGVPRGHHVVWVSNGGQSVPFDLILDGGTNLDLGNIGLFSPDGGGDTGFVQGNIVLSLPGLGGAGGDAGAIGSLFGPGGSNFEINPPQIFPFSLTSEIPGLGVQMTQPLPPGGIFDVFCGLKGEGGLPPGTVFDDLELPSLPTFAGRSTNLGQITWISNGQFEDAGLTPPSNYQGSQDAGVDAGQDAGADAGADAGQDAGFDAGADAGADAGVDAGADAGVDAGADAGPPQWRLLGTVPLPLDSGVIPSSIVPVDFALGQAVLFDEEYYGVYLALAVDGGYGPATLVDPDSSQVLGAIADSRGMLLGLVGIEDSDDVSYVLYSQGGTWSDIQPVDDAGDEVSPYATGNLVPAAGQNFWQVRASAYYVFPEPRSEQVIDLAAFTPPNGPLQVIASYPFVDGGYVYDVRAAPCDVHGDPGLCLVIESNEIDIMSVNLKTGVGTLPYQIQQSINTNPGSISVQAIPDAGLLVGWLEYTAAEVYQPVWIPNLSEAAFACDPTNTSCETPIQYSVNGLGINYSQLMLSQAGSPLVLFPYQDAGSVVTAPGPYSEEAAINLADLVDENLPGAEYLDTYPGGFTDALGRPVVSFVADAGTVIAAEIYTYY